MRHQLGSYSISKQFWYLKPKFPTRDIPQSPCNRYFHFAYNSINFLSSIPHEWQASSLKFQSIFYLLPLALSLCCRFSILNLLMRKSNASLPRRWEKSFVSIIFILTRHRRDRPHYKISNKQDCLEMKKIFLGAGENFILCLAERGKGNKEVLE